MICLAVPVVPQLPPPPYYIATGTFDPQGPNATCMDANQVGALWPMDWGECSRIVADQYGSYYIDANQDRRNLLMQLVTFLFLFFFFFFFVLIEVCLTLQTNKPFQALL